MDPLNGRPHPLPLRPLVWPGAAWATVVLVLANLAAGAIAHVESLRGVPGRDLVVQTLDMNQEASVGTWLTVALALGIAVLALAERAGEAPRERLAWTMTAVVFAGVSIDEIVTLHERLAGLLDQQGYAKILWVVPAALFAGAFVVAIVAVARRSATFPVVGVVTGLAVFAAGALGMKLVSIDLHGPGDGWRYWLLTAFEEGVELAGLVIAARALVGVLHPRGGGSRIGLQPSAHSSHRTRPRSDR